jgi:hypothetical protein
LFTSSDFFFAAAQRAERLKIAFQAVAPPSVAVLCSEAGRPFFVPSLAFRTPEHAEGRWTARRAFLQTAPAVGIRSVIFVNVSRRRVQASVRGRRKVAHLMRSDGRVSRSKVHVVRTLVRPTDHLCGFTRPRVPATGPRYRRALLSVILLAGFGGAFTPLPCASGSRCRRPTCDAAPPPVCAPVPPSRA